MELLDSQKYVSNKMMTIDYENLWPGFRRFKIALYDDDHIAYENKLANKTDEFMANTAIKYNGEFIGIWNLQEEIDLDILTAKLVHETFHAFQFEKQDRRFANELEALIDYRYDVLNLTMKLEENKLIAKMLDKFCKSDFISFVNLRNVRKRMFPYETDYEMRVEQIEGTANFVELESLKQLDMDKYHDMLSGMKRRILNKERFFPIRIVCYDIGALIIKIMRDNDLDIHYDFDDDFYLRNYLQDDDREMNVPIDPELKKQIQAYNDEMQDIIRKNARKDNLLSSGKYKLLGVNIYDARYLDGYISTSYFLAYEDDSGQVIKQGNYLILMEDKQTIKKIYEWTD